MIFFYLLEPYIGNPLSHAFLPSLLMFTHLPHSLLAHAHPLRSTQPLVLSSPATVGLSANAIQGLFYRSKRYKTGGTYRSIHGPVCG